MSQTSPGKLSPCSGSAALRQLKPIHKKGAKSFKANFGHLRGDILSRLMLIS